MSRTVAVIDYGAGNLGNARRAVRELGFREVLARGPEDLPDDGVILLPGVGAYGAAAATLRARGLDRAIATRAARGAEIVAICLGLQLLFTTSEEFGGATGLGILPGTVRRLEAGGRPLPHLGWAPVDPGGTAYYFAHSYRVVPDDPGIVTATARWGEAFPAAVRAGSVTGFQFHPERSGDAGLALLRRALGGRTA